MDVRFTEEQELLRESARDFLARECPMERVRSFVEDPTARADALWPKMAALGWLGLIVPEEHGGLGLGLLELVVLAEEMGRALLPEPFLSSIAVGARAVALAGTEAQRAELLPAVAAGETRVVLAQLEESGSWDERGIGLTATADGDGFVLEGGKRFVADAPLADRLVVPTRDPGAGDGITLFLVPADSPGLSVRRVDFVDRTRPVAQVELSGVRPGADAILGERGAGWPVLAQVADFAKVALCAEMCGAAARVLDMAVDYAKVREQFGKPIGSFQAIQHKCADMLTLLESSRSATYRAAWAVDHGEAGGPDDPHLAACLAKAFVSEAVPKVVGHGIQIHGGIGFTWEQDLHLFYKRALADELAFGGPAFNRELAARVLLDG